MGRESKKTLSDEMNLAEFPLCTLSERTPPGVNQLVFEDEATDPVSGEKYPRRLTVTGQEGFGLPTSKDDEVLVACLKLTADDGFRSRKVSFTPSKFLRLMGWSTDGKDYAKLRRGLDRYTTISVTSEGAFWSKGKKRPVRDVMGVLDRWQASGVDRVTGMPEEGFFVWGDFFWNSLRERYLRTIDFDELLSFEHAASRRLYRFLGKRFYRRSEVAFPLKHFAVNKLGMSSKNANGEIKRTLEKAHTELEDKGFCRAEYSGKGKQMKVTYHSLKNEENRGDPLLTALKRRGVRGAAKLIDSKPRERIEQAIANFDHRNKNGENRKGGWLHNDIAGDSPYEFRDDYPGASGMILSSPQNERAEARKLAREERITGSESQRRKLRQEEFGRWFKTLNEEQKRSFREDATRQSIHSKQLIGSDPVSNPQHATYLRVALLDHWERTVVRKVSGKVG